MVLTREQQDVVDIASGRHLILAPPGTGKTQMLTERVRKALASGTSPSEMLCGTFTIRAAEEMKARIREETGRPEDELPLIGNLHHICHRILFGHHLVSQSRQVVDANFQEEALNALRKKHPPADYFLARHYGRETWAGRDIDFFKFNRDLSDAIALTLALKAEIPSEFLAVRKNPCVGTVFVEEICDGYRKLKDELFVLDFDDLLAETYRALRSARLPANVPRFRWLQVDEVQDLNPLQWAIVEALAAPDAVFVFFGDYEQSIYSFMGASARLLEKKSESCEVHSFETNFRATSYLLDLLSRYSFRTLRSSFAFLPFPHRYESGRDHLRIMRYAGMGEVVREAKRMLDEGLTDNAAILVQTNQQADEAEQSVREAGLPFVKISGFEFGSRKIYRDVAALMDVVANPLARVAWSRLFRHFSRGRLRSQSAAQAFVAEMFGLGIEPRDLLDGARGDGEALRFERYGELVRNGRFVVFDTETTGLDLREDHIVQLTGVEYVNGVPGRQLNLFLKSPIPMPAAAEAVHHISDARLAEIGIDPVVGIRRFLDFVGRDLLIAHNLRFDRTMLVNACRRYQIFFDADAVPMCDTLTLCRLLHPELAVYRLGALLETFDLEGNNSHDALDDVLAAGNLFLKLVEDGLRRIVGQRAWLDANRATIETIARLGGGYFEGLRARLDGVLDLRAETRTFIEYARENRLYTPADCRRIVQECAVGGAEAEGGSGTEELGEGEEISTEELMSPLDKLFDYLDERYGQDPRPFRQIVEEDWEELSKLREADLIPDNARLVISTIHKAKGRQFDTVFIPYCQESYYDRSTGHKVNGFPSFQVLRFGGDRDENARLLYVGMSRAKRNLVLATDAAEPSPYLEHCLECFNHTFVDFYSRVKANGGKLYDFGEFDWMARLYYLICCRKEHREPPEFVKWIDDAIECIRKIAFGLLRTSPNQAVVDEAIQIGLRKSSSIDRALAIRCIASRREVKYVKDMRKLLLTLRTDDKLKADVIAALFACASDPSAVEGLVDAAFDTFAPYRMDAANRLALVGHPEYRELIRGSDEDWCALAGMVDDRVRKVLAWRVAHRLPGHEIYEQLLRLRS